MSHLQIATKHQNVDSRHSKVTLKKRKIPEKQSSMDLPICCKCGRTIDKKNNNNNNKSGISFSLKKKTEKMDRSKFAVLYTVDIGAISSMFYYAKDHILGLELATLNSLVLYATHKIQHLEFKTLQSIASTTKRKWLPVELLAFNAIVVNARRNIQTLELATMGLVYQSVLGFVVRYKCVFLNYIFIQKIIMH